MADNKTHKKPKISTPVTLKPGARSPEPEHGGRGGLDPTRFGDWEKNGRCVDF